MSNATLQLGGGNFAVKDGKLLGYATDPKTSVFVSREFDFSRSSYATRVNADGLIEKETQNLLLQSNQFDTTWGSATSTLTSGQSGYDGSNDAWKISKNQANAQINQSYSDTSVKTLSIYAKADTLNWIAIVGASNSIGYFDLINGVVGTTGGSVIDTNIESAGGGWWRCSVSSAATTSSVTIYPADANNDISGTSGSIYIQDAQLEQGLVARDYIETTTTAVYGGITDNIARIDYTNSSSPALLLEPQRTNLIAQSEYFGDSYWVKTDVSITSNSAVSPSGFTDAAKLTENATNAEHKIYSGIITAVAGDRYTESFFAKSAERNWVYLEHEGAALAWFNLSNGTIGTISGAFNSSASIKEYGNGWYKCIVSYDANDTTSRAYIGVTNADAVKTYLGDGSSGIYFWGAQLEEGSYATSYIPTYGTAVTRSVDNPIISSAGDIIDINQGTLFVDATIDSSVDTEIYLMKFDGVNFNDTLYLYRSAIGKIQGVYRIGGSAYKQETTGAISARFKAVFAYDSNNECTVYVNGSKIGSSFSIPTPSVNLTAVRLGGFNDTLAKQSGLTHQSTYFPTALTDAECITLTTL